MAQIVHDLAPGAEPPICHRIQRRSGLRQPDPGSCHGRGQGHRRRHHLLRRTDVPGRRGRQGGRGRHRRGRHLLQLCRQREHHRRRQQRRPRTRRRRTARRRVRRRWWPRTPVCSTATTSTRRSPSTTPTASRSAARSGYVLGWNEPQFGIATDLDFCVLNHSNGAVLACSLADNLVTQKTFETFSGSLLRLGRPGRRSLRRDGHAAVQVRLLAVGDHRRRIPDRVRRGRGRADDLRAQRVTVRRHRRGHSLQQRQHPGDLLLARAGDLLLRPGGRHHPGGATRVVRDGHGGHVRHRWRRRTRSSAEAAPTASTAPPPPRRTPPPLRRSCWSGRPALRLPRSSPR